ncbi:MAG TPA: bi-domain-containing oxidoreductase [Anaerolineales bacterium]|nr:bi-domain-containing oxidoreductase [Anaerolineales bacterium]HND93798.1 bi-domain-containing oxidoreductase [Anaerolineales bacterium]HNJ15023.1 bi-domain-containing oxidoreductase [Anaerolineales bacterium]HNO84661.1 bi-domain-containing oxidoreductase [Anaerolineales bacterium]
MKQLLQNIKNGNTTVEDIPIPTPREGQALIKVAASLVSAGTERMVVEFAEKSYLGKARSRPDLVKQTLDKAKREGIMPTVNAVFNRLDQPMALGYSTAGTIVALGKNMQGFKVGQRVACAGGGYATHAEYNVVPRNLLTPLPKNVDFESAAFTTLGAIALHGLRLAEPQLGENVAVIGLGLLGLMTIQLAAAAGCNVLGIDLDPKRIKLASSLGLEAVSRQNAESASAAHFATANRGFDSIIICADTPSNDPVELAGVIARDRAKVVATGAVGLNFPRKIYYEKEISFINSRSYGPGRYDSNYEENGNDYPIGYIRWTEGRNFQAVVDLMASGKLKVTPLISHRFDIIEGVKAYEVITGKRKEPFLGVVLKYPEEKMKEERKIVFPSIAHRSSSVVKLGVLGAGLYANATLLPVLKDNKDYELIGIASSGGLHAQHSGKKFGFQYATSSEDEIINDPKINTVAILTRHDTHADLAIKALKAGKHVFVEKPLAINSNQLSVVSKQLLKTDHCLLTTGFNRRFSPLARSLKSQLESLQEPKHLHYRVNAGFIPANHWTQDEAIGGGRIIGEACHFIDTLTFLVGALPVKVSAQALPNNGKYREDNVSMTFTFADGSIGVVDYLANGDKSMPKERLEVFCGGMVAVLDDYVSLNVVKDGKRKEEKGAQDKGWRGEMAAFAEAVQGKGEAPIPYGQIIAVTKSTFAAVESIRSGNPVEIK